MAVTITIDGNDRTDKVELFSLEIRNILTRQRDTCIFNIVEHQGDTYVPKNGQEIIIEDNGTKIFAGIIVSTQSTAIAFGQVTHQISCQDYTRLLDRKLVPDSFKNQTVDQIIATLKSLYFPSEITTNNVDAPVTIDYVGFNYLPLSKCLEQLANMLNYDWYVDYDKDLHFFKKETKNAPFQLNDDDGSYDYRSLVIRRDNSQIRNTIIVRGGSYLGSQTTVDRQADGQQTIIPTRYKFSDFEASVTGNPLNVGIDYINNPDDFDALYNYNEKLLRFKEADKPSAGALVKVAGKPNLPVIVKYQDPAHIQATRSAELGSGIYEYLIEDKTINSKEGARQRAEAEVLAYATTLSEGEFLTETAGLQAGQRIFVNSTSRNIGEYFIINKVRITQRTNDKLRYEVSLITTRTFDLIDVLQRLLLESTKKIEILEDEVIDLVEGFPAETISMSEVISTSTSHNPQTETITLGESFTAQSIDYDVEFVYGPQSPSGLKRVFIIGGSRVGPNPS